jgi:hypothetical protein
MALRLKSDISSLLRAESANINRQREAEGHSCDGGTNFLLAAEDKTVKNCPVSGPTYCVKPMGIEQVAFNGT